MNLFDFFSRRHFEEVKAIDNETNIFLGHMLANDTWQKEEILAAKLENFLTTVHIRR